MIYLSWDPPYLNKELCTAVSFSQCLFSLFCFQETGAEMYFKSTVVEPRGGSGYYVFHQYPIITCQPHMNPSTVQSTHIHTHREHVQINNKVNICSYCMFNLECLFYDTVQPECIWEENTTDRTAAAGERRIQPEVWLLYSNFQPRLDPASVWQLVWNKWPQCFISWFLLVFKKSKIKKKRLKA